MCIGEKISQMRKQNNMTQKDLAEKLNVSDNVISKWETGKCLPDVETMLKLSKVLDVSISELYECVERTDTKKTEEYSEERVWAYKKYSIISCFLVIMSLVLFLLTAVEWTRFYDIRDILNFILTMTSIASFTLGIFFQLTQFIRLFSYSQTKFYQTEYKEVLKKYGIIFLICLSIIPLFILACYIASLLV